MKQSRFETTKELARKTLIGTGKVAKTSSITVARIANTKAADIKRRRGPLSASNWYVQAAVSCEAVSDAILRRNKGTSKRVARMTAAKVGVVGAPATIFSIAALLGTASTGTAIGSLSGAAFTSAALAWVGGSVAAGSIIVGVAGIAGGLGAVLGAGWVTKKYVFGKKRGESELSQEEKRLVDACLSLAAAFRNEEAAGRKVDPLAAKALYDEALLPLCAQLIKYQPVDDGWPEVAKLRLRRAIYNFRKFVNKTTQFTRQRPNLTTGLVGAVLTQLLADDIPNFDANEQLVLDALRRAKNNLATASDEELAAYVQSLEPSQLQGLSSLLVGVSHELRYYVEENSDGDEYVVELFEATNHPGADVRIINTLTGDVKEVQLKASKYMSHVTEHNERYADVSVMATAELAARNGSIESSGISHEDLNQDVGSVVEGLREVDNPGVLSSMSVAAMLALARNVNVLLKGKSVGAESKCKLVKDGTESALIAGLVHTIIG